MSEIKLLPCPFCGEKKKIQLNPFIKNKWYVECGSCFSAAYFSDSEEEAMAKWNNRKPIDDMVEQIHGYFKSVIEKSDSDNVPLEVLDYNKAICDIVRGGRE